MIYPLWIKLHLAQEEVRYNETNYIYKMKLNLYIMV
jgi:hypothetical protein